MPRQLWSQVKGWPVLLSLLLIASAGIAYAAWSFRQPQIAAIRIAQIVPSMLDVPSGGQTTPDEDDDEIDPQGDEDDFDSDPTNDDEDANDDIPDVESEEACGASGPGLHVTLATGNVWTKIPVLRTYGGGQTSLALTLYYDRLKPIYYGDSFNRLGRRWSHTYDIYYYFVAPHGTNPAKVVIVNGDGRRSAFRKPNPNVESFINPPGRSAFLRCGGTNCELYELVFPDGGLWRFDRSSKRIAEIVSPRGLTTRFTYQYSWGGNLLNVVDGYGRTIQFDYNTDGRISEIIHPDLKSTLISYDPNDSSLLKSVEDPNDETITFDYQTNGSSFELTKEILKNGTTFTCDYDNDPEDGMSRTIKVLNDQETEEQVLKFEAEVFCLLPSNHVIDWTEVKITDGRNNVWTYLRNGWGQLIQRTTPSLPDFSYFDSYASFGYSTNHWESFNKLTSRTDMKGHTTDYEWAVIGTSPGVPNGRIKKITRPGGHVTEFLYENEDFPGLVTKRIEPNGAFWKYTYNEHGDVTEIQDPVIEPGEGLDRVNKFVYDYYENDEGVPSGQPLRPGRIKKIKHTDGNGHVTVREYAMDGDLTSKTIYSAFDEQTQTILTQTTYEHDDMGRTTKETTARGDNTSSITEYEYDDMGRKTKEIVGFGSLNLTTEYGYDGHGLLTSIKNPKEIVTKFEHDYRNRMVKQTEDFGEDPENKNFETVYGYDGNTNVTSIRDANQNESTYQYNVLNNLERSVDAEGFETLYTRDPEGNLEIVDRDRDRNHDPEDESERDVTQYTYDNLYRVTSKTIALGAPEALTTSFEYKPTSSGCGCGAIGSRIPYRTIDPSGRNTFRQFDQRGRVTAVVRKVGDTNESPDSTDAVTTYGYDPEGNLVDILGPEGEQSIFTYDAADRLKTRTVKVDPGDDLVTTLNYDGAGNLNAVILPNGHTLTAEYDPADRLEHVVDADGDLITYEYDANGNILEQIDALNRIWVYQYDRLDRRTKAFDPIIEAEEDRFAEFQYDNVGNLILSINNNKIWTKRDYDMLNRLTKLTEDYVEEQESLQLVQLDGEGEQGLQAQGLILVEGEAGYAQGQGGQSSLQELTTPTENTETHYIYDGSRLIGLRDHDGNQTDYTYDLAGRLSKTTYPQHDPGNPQTPNPDSVSLAYDVLNGIDEVHRTDQRGIVTTLKFDELKYLKERNYAIGTSAPYRKEVFVFDKSGRLNTATRNRADSFDDPQYGFKREYDKAGRPLEETQNFHDDGATYPTTFEYDLDTTAHSASILMHTPNGRDVLHTFDKLNRLIEATSGSDIGVTWDVDQAGRRTNAYRRNDGYNMTEYFYDDNDRVTDITHWKDGGMDLVPVLTFGYGYDPAGNRLFTRKGPSIVADRSELYGPDNRDRLTTMERGHLNSQNTEIVFDLNHPTLASTQQWVNLDRRGNWLELRQSANQGARAQTRTANGVNEYMTIDPDKGGSLPEVPYDHDPAGNLLFDPRAKVVGDGTTPSGQWYKYDEENRVVEIRKTDDEGQLLYQFAYDAIGRRVQTIEYVNAETGSVLSSPKVIRHVYAGLETIEEYTCASAQPCNCEEQGCICPSNCSCTDDTQHCDKTWDLLREFVWGDSSRFPEPVAMIDHAGSEPSPEAECLSGGVGGLSLLCVYHYLHDSLGSVVGLTDSSGTLVERYTYDPYGKTLIEKSEVGTTNWIATNTSSYGNPFAWTGQRYDAATGTYHFPYRTYLPGLGRWLQRDPLQYVDGISLYEYVRGNPLSAIDPLGLLRIYIWRFRGSLIAWGHVSIELDDGTYISWWPGSERTPSRGPIYRAPARQDQGLQDDIQGENGLPPDYAIDIDGLDEAAIAQAWKDWQANDPNWRTCSRNCSTAVYNMLAAGVPRHILDRYWWRRPLIWTPSSIRRFAQWLQKKMAEEQRKQEEQKKEEEAGKPRGGCGLRPPPESSPPKK